MKIITQTILTLCLSSILLISCKTEPQTKEQFLKTYDSFIEEIKNNKDTYSAADWKEKDKELEYLTELQEKFKNELNWKDQIVLGKNLVKYNLYSSQKEITNSISEILKDDDVQAFRKKAEEYAEKGLENDLEFLLKQAEDVGGDASKVVEEIIKEFNKEKNN